MDRYSYEYKVDVLSSLGTLHTTLTVRRYMSYNYIDEIYRVDGCADKLHQAIQCLDSDEKVNTMLAELFNKIDQDNSWDNGVYGL